MFTATDVAQRLGLTLCTYCSRPGHDGGVVVGLTLHRSDTRITRLGLRHILVSAARVLMFQRADLRLPSKHGKVLQLYSYDRWAASRARSLFGVRFPRRYSESDRATAAWLISRYELKVPKAIRTWATYTEDNAHG